MAFVTKVRAKKFDDENVPLSSSNDFKALGENQPIDDVVSYFLENGKHFSVYTVDWKNETVVLVKCKDRVDPKLKAFLYMGQRKEAGEVLTLPFSQLQAVADAAAESTKNVQEIFAYQTGRSGSTLLAKAADALPSMQGISEPDVYSVIAVDVEKARRGLKPKGLKDIPDILLDEDAITKLLRNVTTLNNYFFLMSDPDQRATIMYKMKACVLRIGKMMAKAHPTAKTIFLYRDGMDTMESYFFFQYMDRDEYMYWVRNIKKGRRRQDLLEYIQEDDSIYGDDPSLNTPPSSIDQMYYYITLWQGAMQDALDLHNDDPDYFFHGVINYAALASQDGFFKLLEKLGVTVEEGGSDKVAVVFERDCEQDVQPGGEAKAWKKRGMLCFQATDDCWERKVFDKVCEATKKEIRDPGFIFPNTIS